MKYHIPHLIDIVSYSVMSRCVKDSESTRTFHNLPIPAYLNCIQMFAHSRVNGAMSHIHLYSRRMRRHHDGVNNTIDTDGCTSSFLISCIDHCDPDTDIKLLRELINGIVWRCRGDGDAVACISRLLSRMSNKNAYVKMFTDFLSVPAIMCCDISMRMVMGIVGQSTPSSRVYTATVHDDVDTVSSIIDSGFNIHGDDCMLITVAVRSHAVGVLQLLIERGMTNAERLGALKRALTIGGMSWNVLDLLGDSSQITFTGDFWNKVMTLESAKWMLARHAPIDDNTVRSVCMNDKLDVLKLLIEGGHAQVPSDILLHICATFVPYPSIELINYLVSHGADVNAVDAEFGTTVLSSSPYYVRYYLDVGAGASATVLDEKGYDALMYYVESENEEYNDDPIVHALCNEVVTVESDDGTPVRRYAIDLDATNANGDDAFAIAMSRGHIMTAALIKNIARHRRPLLVNGKRVA